MLKLTMPIYSTTFTQILKKNQGGMCLLQPTIESPMIIIIFIYHHNYQEAISTQWHLYRLLIIATEQAVQLNRTNYVNIINICNTFFDLQIQDMSQKGCNVLKDKQLKHQLCCLGPAHKSIGSYIYWYAHFKGFIMSSRSKNKELKA